MYISLSAIFFIFLAAWLISVFSEASSSHAGAIRNKNQLIKEAESAINSTKDLSWTEMTIKQREVHECAIDRLKVLKSYKKNHSPESFPFLREWPLWYEPSTSIIKD